MRPACCSTLPSASRATTRAIVSTTTRARLLLMALIEDAGTEDSTDDARARVTLPGLRQPRVQQGLRTLPEFHVLLSPVARRVADRRTATGARCGRWVPSSAAPAIQGSRASVVICSMLRCRRSRPSQARGRGPSRCWGSTSTCARSRATATCMPCARRWRSGCSTSSGGRAGTSGRGSKTGSLTATRDCRRR